MAVINKEKFKNNSKKKHDKINVFIGFFKYNSKEYFQLNLFDKTALIGPSSIGSSIKRFLSLHFNETKYGVCEILLMLFIHLTDLLMRLCIEFNIIQIYTYVPPLLWLQCIRNVPCIQIRLNLTKGTNGI